jgi:hypothetical protein
LLPRIAKSFWFDELQTLQISSLPSLGRIWDALIHGADFNPPLLFSITHLSQAVFGNGHIGTRLPEILGFWVFCLCLFRFVSMRFGALAGFITMGVPLLTTSYSYATEARAYGIVLGFCGLALVCWQSCASRSDRRFWPAVGLFVSLAAALLTHTYAFLLFIPPAAGEVMRFVTTRRFDRVTAAALCAAAPAVLVSVPLLASARRLGAGSEWGASVRMLLHTYDALFHPIITLLVVVVAIIFIEYAIYGSTRITESRCFELHEQVVLFTFLSLPIFAYLAAAVSKAPMMDRYSLATVTGLACLIGVTISRRNVLGLLGLVVMSFLIAVDAYGFRTDVEIIEPSSSTAISTWLDGFKERYKWMADEKTKNLPIVLLDDLDFVPTIYYAPQEIASRLVYIKDSEDDIDGLLYENMQRCCNAPGVVSTFPKFLSTTNKFLVFGTKRTHRRVNRLVEEGANVSIEKTNNDYGLLLVNYPPRHLEAESPRVYSNSKKVASRF